MGRNSTNWVMVAVLFCGLVVLIHKHRAPRPMRHLNTAEFALVRVAMTQAEVEGILGGPPSEYGQYAGNTAMMTLEGAMEPRSQWRSIGLIT